MDQKGLVYILSKAPLTIIIYLGKVAKHSSSNGCLSLYHSILFLVLSGCPKSKFLHEIWELLLAEINMVPTIKGSYILSEAPLIIDTDLRKVAKHSSGNLCPSL